MNIPSFIKLQESSQSDSPLADGEPASDEIWTTDDDEMDSSPSADNLTLFNIISLEHEFEGFFGLEVGSLLIRKEYIPMMEHLEGLYAKQERGVVVLGQPGIGKSLHRTSQFYTKSLL